MIIMAQSAEAERQPGRQVTIIGESSHLIHKLQAEKKKNATRPYAGF